MITKKDIQMMNIANNAKTEATCLKKKLGCILVTKDNIIVEGWNGPPLSLPKCNPCTKGIGSGIETGHLCRAVHAERRCLLLSARLGYPTDESTYYGYMGIPCKDCLLELIEAGVSRIVCENGVLYDKLSESILKEWVDNGGIFEVCPMGAKPTHDDCRCS